MKTITFSFLIYFLLTVPFAIAQNADKGKLTDTVSGVINMQNLTGKNPEDTNLNYKSKPGYQVVVNVYIPTVPMFFFQPGLLYITKRAKQVNDQSAGKYTLSNDEMPLNVVYKSMLGNGYVMSGFGPFISYDTGRESILQKRFRFERNSSIVNIYSYFR
jgi:hypothetical protein